MNSEETLRKDDEATNRILEAIGGLRQGISNEISELRQDVNNQISELRQEMNNQISELRQETRQQIGDLRREMNERFTRVETEIVEIKELQFSFDVRLERVQAMAHDALNIGHDLKADVKILHAEVRAWAQDVLSLEKKFI